MVAFEFEERACHAVTWDTGISDQRMKQLKRSANVRTSLWRSSAQDQMVDAKTAYKNHDCTWKLKENNVLVT